MRRPSAWLRSLGGRLLLAIGAPLTLLLIIGAVIDYASARRLTDEAHDRALASLAVGLSARLEAEHDSDLASHLPNMVKALGRTHPQDRLLYWVDDQRHHLSSGDASLAPVRRQAAPATDSPEPYFENATVHGQPMRVAVYEYHGPEGRASILVAETLHGRSTETRHLLFVTAATNLMTALAAVAAALVAVRFALRPLDRLGQRLEAHEARALRSMRLREVPTEVVPLVRALNRLMRRVRTSVQARQAFLNTTAHQLRTPLASLTTQVDLLRGSPLPPEARQHAGEVAESVQRLTHLTQQMLALARADAEAATALPTQPVSLPELLQQAASACLDAAIARHIDLGFDPQPAVVLGTPWLLHELLLNLVHNAIAHTPPGTTVTARCGMVSGHAYLEVEDDGPGIPPADRARVFDRFVRLEHGDRHGTGLGLAIVREVAERHGATVQVLDPPSGHGSRVRVDFAASASGEPGRPAPATQSSQRVN